MQDYIRHKPTLPTDFFEYVNTSISCINTLDMDDIEGSNSCNLREIAKCSTLPCNILDSW